jgi:glucose-6-phosphate isomerase
VEIPNNFDDIDTMAYLSGQKMSKLLNAEESATENALTKNQRANMTITMPEISEFTMGQLIYMLEVETAFIGELYDINAFDQPGVETGKTAAFALMGRKGYKERIKELSNGKSIAKYII